MKKRIKLTKKEMTILYELFKQCHKQKAWVNTDRFTADHYKDVLSVKSLVDRGLIKAVSSNTEYRIAFGVFDLLDDDLIEKMYHYMSRIFKALKQYYLKKLNKQYKIVDLIDDLKIEKDFVLECLLYLKDVLTIAGTTDRSTPDAYITLSNQILEFHSFDDLIERQYHFWGVKEPAEKEVKKLNNNQIDKKICQAVALTIWHFDPSLSTTAVCKHDMIQRIAGGNQYTIKTLRDWFSDIEKPEAASKPGRKPKK